MNRDIRRRNALLVKVKRDFAEAAAVLDRAKLELIKSLAAASAKVTGKAEETAVVIRNSLTEMIGKIVQVFHRMLVPTQGKYIYRLRGREELQSPEYMYRLVRKYNLQDERDLEDLYIRLEKKLVRSSSDRAAILTDLAVIESYRYSRHRLQMEVIRGHQPKSLLISGKRDIADGGTPVGNTIEHTVPAKETVKRREETR